MTAKKGISIFIIFAVCALTTLISTASIILEKSVENHSEILSTPVQTEIQIKQIAQEEEKEETYKEIRKQRAIIRKKFAKIEKEINKIEEQKSARRR